MMKIIQSMRRCWPVLMRIVVIQTLGVALSIACASCSGCATSGYMKDRMRDGADVFTATVGVGAGAKVRVGPVQAGLITMGDSIGLRGGRFYSYDRYVFGGDMCLIIAGIEDFNCMGRAVGPRRKEFATAYCVVPIPMDFKGGPRLNASYWTQIEAVIGIGGTLRLGFNPGELLDFILGWTTIDIYGDDLEAKKQEVKSNLTSEGIRQPADGSPKPSM